MIARIAASGRRSVFPQEPGASRRWRPPLLKVGALLPTAAILVCIVLWALLLRPQSLGGPATWVIVSGTSMKPTLHSGDLVITHRAASYRRGDVIAYHVPKGEPGEGALVIHRIKAGSGKKGYVMQGDNRETKDLWRPKTADIAGKRWLTLSGTGRLLAVLRTPLGLAMAAGLAAFLIIALPVRKRESRSDP